MKKLFAVMAFLAISSPLMAQNITKPDRVMYSEQDFTRYVPTTTVGVGSPNTSNINLSSGVVKVKWLYISSAGVNSQLILYDNRLSGETSNQIIILNTNAVGYQGPFDLETSTAGLIYTSTNVTPAPWNQPTWTLGIRRVQ